jgi:hypothetical protein
MSNNKPTTSENVDTITISDSDEEPVNSIDTNSIAAKKFTTSQYKEKLRGYSVIS